MSNQWPIFCSAQYGENLQDSYITTWRKQLWNDICWSGGTYRLFKTVFAWEFYLSRITERSHLIAVARFRTSCHSLAIETRRYTILPTPPELCLCTYCTKLNGKVDNELHFITEYCHLDTYRKSLYSAATDVSSSAVPLVDTISACVWTAVLLVISS